MNGCRQDVYEGESIEFEVSQLTHRSRSPPASISEPVTQAPKSSLDERHNQLMGQIERLVRAQNGWQVDRQKFELEIKECRSQVKRLREENSRLTQLMRQKDSLYEELREQLHVQLAVIERLEK